VIGTFTARHVIRNTKARVLHPCLLLIVFSMVFLFGCQEPEAVQQASGNGGAGSCTLGLATDATDQAKIEAVLNAEGTSVVSQDIDGLMRLWHEDGRVSDAKNTPDDSDDDQTWDGRDAIRHRYVRTVFPGAPSTAQPADLDITIDGDSATVIATTHIGQEVSPAGDRWELVNIEGCWVLQGLTYNLEVKP
jgi:hypothetical protein